MRDFINIDVWPWNGDILQSMAFFKTDIVTTGGVVYVYGSGLVMIGQFVELGNFYIPTVNFLSSKLKPYEYGTF